MKVLLFDYDGVIVDSLELWTKSFLEISERKGFGIKNQKEYLELSEGNFYDGLKKRGVPEEKIKKGIQELSELRRHMDDVSFFKGIPEVLDELSKKNVMKIVTSNHGGLVEERIRGRWFDEILGAEKHQSKARKITIVKEKFPDYEIFYIGDTKGDMKEGKEAKVKTVAVTWGWHGRRVTEEGPDFVVDSPEELLSLFIDEK